MQVGCTQKLIDYLDCEICSHNNDALVLFNFTAKLITVARRKCIAVIHNESRCGFVLYGITAKEKKNIRALILQGIEKMLRKERYSDEIINKFLSDCGDICFTKTVGRVYISRINKFCERVIYYAGFFRSDSLFQEHLLPKLNEDFVKYGGDYQYAFVKLPELIQEHYATAPYCYRAAVLDIDLQLCSVCHRRIVVPFDISLYQLHIMIQSVFEWENNHIHGFTLKTDKNKDILEYASPTPEEDACFMNPDTKIYNELEIRLSDVFPEKKSIIYEYDFGDGWLHTIKFVKEIQNCTLSAPICETAEGLAPPDDCGGISGFERLKKILSNPKDEEYGDMVFWYGHTEIRNKNITHINSLLREAIRVFPEDWLQEDTEDYDYE